MTDKVQKIREEVERLQNELIQEKEKGFGSDTDDACILELQNVLTYIDSLQEEPVSEVWHDANEEQPEGHRAVVVWNPTTMDGEVLTRCVEVYKGWIWAYIDDILKLSNVERIRKNWKEPKFKVGDRIKFKGIHNEDVTRVITDIKEGEGVGFRYFFADGNIYSIGDDGIELVEEPVSEDLEEVAHQYYESNDKFMDGFKKGAKWQKQQDKETIELAEDHAMLAGMEKMKQKMIEKSVPADVMFDYYDDKDRLNVSILATDVLADEHGIKENDNVFFTHVFNSSLQSYA